MQTFDKQLTLSETSWSGFLSSTHNKSLKRDAYFFAFWSYKNVQKLLWPLTFHLKEFQCIIILDNLSRLLCREQWDEKREFHKFFSSAWWRSIERNENLKIHFCSCNSSGWIKMISPFFLLLITSYFFENGKTKMNCWKGFNKDLCSLKQYFFLLSFFKQFGIVGEVEKSFTSSPAMRRLNNSKMKPPEAKDETVWEH